MTAISLPIINGSPGAGGGSSSNRPAMVLSSSHALLVYAEGTSSISSSGLPQRQRPCVCSHDDPVRCSSPSRLTIWITQSTSTGGSIEEAVKCSSRSWRVCHCVVFTSRMAGELSRALVTRRISVMKRSSGSPGSSSVSMPTTHLQSAAPIASVSSGGSSRAGSVQMFSATGSPGIPTTIAHGTSGSSGESFSSTWAS